MKIKILALLAISGLLTLWAATPANAFADSTCSPDGLYSMADVDLGITVCQDSSISIALGAGSQQVEAPQGGAVISLMYASPTDLDFNQVSVFTDDNQKVGLVIDGVPHGATLVAGSSGSIETLATYPGCGSTSYSLLPNHWNKTYSWYYNSSNSPSSSALSELQSSVSLWKSGVNRCTGQTYSSSFASQYVGSTSLSPNFSITTSGGASTIGCGSPDANSVIGWLRPTGTSTLLAATCTWPSGSLLNIAGESDVFVNRNSSFYFGTSTAGCTGSLYDFREIVTHEFGHVVGLGHSYQSDGQIMKPNFSPCETGERLLAPGDISGLNVWY
ncbi:MAG: hypothetical protein RL196_427 [Actinomycetota bacterium]|jgi:hypothetical protein